jgi:hypothetical protein
MLPFCTAIFSPCGDSPFKREWGEGNGEGHGYLPPVQFGC